MEWLSLESAIILAVLVLPGFVFTVTKEHVVPSPRRDFSKSVVEFLGYGGINFVLFSWILIPKIPEWSRMQFVSLDYIIIIVVSVIWPAIASIVWMKIGKSRTLHRIAGMGNSARSHEPTAWDFFFGRREQACWILARFRDGTNMAGIFDVGSYASRYPEEPSLYISRVYHTDENGQITEPVPGSAGALIKGADIKLLEMWDIQPQEKEE